MDLFSIGESCQVAHQIRRYFKKNTAHFFDWTSTRGTSYKALFLDDALFFQMNNCKVVEKNEYSIIHNKKINFGKVWVVDNYSGLHFQHEFEHLSNSNLIDESKIESHLPIAKNKFSYLKDKTINAIISSKLPILVRLENVKSIEDAISLGQDIYDNYKHLNSDLKVVVTSYFLDNDYEIDNKIYIFKIDPSQEWSGDDESWNRVFSTIIKKHPQRFHINYDFWKTKVHREESTSTFINNILEDGIHSLELTELPLDILVKNSSEIQNNEYILVTFSAAVARKDNLAPFFSLSSVAGNLNLPLVAFSDPTMSLNKSLTLGWYAGNKYYPNLPVLIAGICDDIMNKTGKKILFVGGSGGGFASLNIQDLMKRKEDTKAIVWNPQTDLIAYSKKAVLYYLKAAYEDKNNIVNADNLKHFLGSRVKNILNHNPDLDRLILMDGYDCRHIRDLKIFLGNINDGECKSNILKIDNTTICFGDWGRFGDGHSQPPVNVLSSIISDVAKGNSYDDIDALINKTNTTSRKLFMLKNKQDLNNVKIFGSFFDNFLEIDSNLPELFFGFDVSIRLVEKESNKVIYWGKRQEFTIKSRELIKLDSVRIDQMNMHKYDIHLSIRDFFNNQHIMVRKLSFLNSKIFNVGVL